MFKLSIFKGEEKAADLRDSYKGRDSLPLKVSIKAAFHMIRLYWTSKDSIRSWILLVLIIALTSGAIYLATAINTWYKDFWDTIQNYDLPGFKHHLLVFALLATIHVLVSVYNSYLRTKMCIYWRRWFTQKVMHDYLNNNAYYKLQLLDKHTENPDQRISEDLSSFVTLTTSLILGTLSDLAMLGTFGVVLWNLSSAVEMEILGHTLSLPDGYMLYLAVGYALIGTCLTFIIGKPLVRLNFRQQRYEANFRFSLIRVRENSESISLYKGEKTEEQYLNSNFTDVVKNYLKLIFKEKNLGFFTLGYAQLAVIFPILISAPMYFAKIITMGSIMQISSAFSRVQDSLSTVISSFSSWASYKAVVDRLALFFDGMDASDEIHCLIPKYEGEEFKTNKLSVYTPMQQLLCNQLDLSLKPGDSMLIRGPSGCGKSTLIKSIAGIWPNAKGEVIYPKDSKCLFLSQKPYLPQGTLREALSYPGEIEREGRLEHYLKALNLEHLIEKLDVEDNYSLILSLGEQQRIAIIRALIIKPNLLFLDEASSALDEMIEQKSYQMLLEELKQSIIISVGHRSSLIKLHKLSLTFEGDSQFKLKNN